MENKEINIVILSAGKGSRMKSELPKVLHKIANRTIFDFVLNYVNQIEKYDKNIIAVTSNDIIGKFNQSLKTQDNLHYVIQNERMGTGHAVRVAMDSPHWKSENEWTFVLLGDVPFIQQETLKKMLLLQRRFDFMVLGFDCKDQSRPYGRLFTDKELEEGYYGELYQIKEFKDLMREKPRLCNSGVMLGKTKIFEEFLPQLKTNNKQKEYYLTDVVEMANDAGYRVGTYICDEYEVIGINSRVELAHAEKEYQQRVREEHMNSGATMLDSDSVYFSYDTQIGKDVIIEPYVYFGSGVQVCDNCIIKAGSYLENVKVKEGEVIEPNSILVGKKN